MAFLDDSTKSDSFQNEGKNDTVTTADLYADTETQDTKQTIDTSILFTIDRTGDDLDTKLAINKLQQWYNEYCNNPKCEYPLKPTNTTRTAVTTKYIEPDCKDSTITSTLTDTGTATGEADEYKEDSAVISCVETVRDDILNAVKLLANYNDAKSGLCDCRAVIKTKEDIFIENQGIISVSKHNLCKKLRRELTKLREKQLPKLKIAFENAKTEFLDGIAAMDAKIESMFMEMIDNIENMSKMKEYGFDSIVRCFKMMEDKEHAQSGVSYESKMLLKECVKWEYELYSKSKNNDNKEVLNNVYGIVRSLDKISHKYETQHSAYMNITEAKQTTQKISSKITGDLKDKNTLFHVLSTLVPNALFYDPKVKTNSYIFSQEEERKENEKNIEYRRRERLQTSTIMKLSVVPGLEYIHNIETNDKINYKRKQYQTLARSAEKQLISEMIYSLENLDNDGPKTHPILQKIRSTLTGIFGVNSEDILITHVYDGCCCFGYTVSNTQRYRDVLNDPNIDAVFRAKFDFFENNRIHPSMFNAFNVNDFDIRGNKDFTNRNSTFQIGPPNKKQTYTQPHGWTRYGLNVLNGKYGLDHTWLEPFRHNNNWYRAYHGVSNTGAEMSIPHIIHTNGFLPGPRQAKQNHDDLQVAGRKVGLGVYCTPAISVAAGSYSDRSIAIRLNDGSTKRFQMVFQVCVDPNQVRISSRSPNYWVAPNAIGKIDGNGVVVNDHVEDNIRAYGILLKEV